MKKLVAVGIAVMAMMVGAGGAVAEERPEYVRTAYNGVVWEVADIDAHPLT